MQTKPTKNIFFGEIQVRTIFEEAWSEIDHTIRYPYNLDNPVFSQFLFIFNRLAGSADEMGTFISFLRDQLKEIDIKHQQVVGEKDKIINELESRIKDLKLKESDSKFLTEGLERLKLPSYKSVLDLSHLPHLQTIIGSNAASVLNIANLASSPHFVTALKSSAAYLPNLTGQVISSSPGMIMVPTGRTPQIIATQGISEPKEKIETTHLTSAAKKVAAKKVSAPKKSESIQDE